GYAPCFWGRLPRFYSTNNSGPYFCFGRQCRSTCSRLPIAGCHFLCQCGGRFRATTCVTESRCFLHLQSSPQSPRTVCFGLPQACEAKPFLFSSFWRLLQRVMFRCGGLDQSVTKRPW